ncbi:MAG TPA: citrate synthase/methylcitrate synthase [Steroidobacteraceae bacterium]|nr:citrate synthase/methylcitrate synthase [Steroidobacteraceae bacterium]
MSGLDGVIAAETTLSDVDGEAGRLIIRGRSLDELVAGYRYEDVLALLWETLFPECNGADRLAAALGEARARVFNHLRAADGQLLALPPVDAIRSLISRLEDGSDLTTALNLVAASAVFTPGVLRLATGRDAIRPDPALAHAADMLRMLRGRTAGPEQVVALDRYLVSAVDHGLNASTFTARVIASTRSGLTSALVGALCALKGPLHGGAPGPVLDMLDAIGQPQAAGPWLEAALARGERLMGFGHRIYRVRDPRADAIKGTLDMLTQAGGLDPVRLRLAEAVERAALDLLSRHKPQRPLLTNLEFYTALLLEALGFPREAFTCVFAAGRAGGWVAHAREQVLRGRLIRPLSRYVGPWPSAAA